MTIHIYIYINVYATVFCTIAHLIGLYSLAIKLYILLYLHGVCCSLFFLSASIPASRVTLSHFVEHSSLIVWYSVGERCFRDLYQLFNVRVKNLPSNRNFMFLRSFILLTNEFQHGVFSLSIRFLVRYVFRLCHFTSLITQTMYSHSFF